MSQFTISAEGAETVTTNSVEEADAVFQELCRTARQYGETPSAIIEAHENGRTFRITIEEF